MKYVKELYDMMYSGDNAGDIGTLKGELYQFLYHIGLRGYIVLMETEFIDDSCTSPSYTISVNRHRCGIPIEIRVEWTEGVYTYHAGYYSFSTEDYEHYRYDKCNPLKPTKLCQICKTIRWHVK